MRFKYGFLLLCAGFLAACNSTPTKPPLNKQTIAANAPQAIPKYEPRTIAGNKNPYTVWGKTYHVLPTALGYSETGHASWYGPKFHGRNTSNGEVFDMYAVSAAHKTLPIPSYVKVTNLANQRSLWVRVNDRGPFIGERLIDLSYAAALQLGFVEQGVANVRIDAVEFNADGSMQQLTPLKPEVIAKDVTFANSQLGLPAQNTQMLVTQEGSNKPNPELLTSNITNDDTPANITVSKDTRTYIQVGRYRDETAARDYANRVYGLLNQPVVIHKDQNQSFIIAVGPLEEAQLSPLKARLAASGFKGAFTRRGL